MRTILYTKYDWQISFETDNERFYLYKSSQNYGSYSEYSNALEAIKRAEKAKKKKEGKMKKEGRMCCIVKKDSQEISTVKEFREAFPDVPIVQHFFIKSLADEYCLCQVDMKTTLDQASIKHIFDGSCYTILELTNGLLLIEQLQVIAEEFEDEQRPIPKAVIDEVIQILQRRTKIRKKKNLKRLEG